MLVEDCDMCEWGCILFVCGAMAIECMATGPAYLACLVAMCGLSVLGCCVAG